MNTVEQPLQPPAVWRDESAAHALAMRARQAREVAETEADEQSPAFQAYLRDEAGEEHMQSVLRAALGLYAVGAIHGGGTYAYADMARAELSRACDALRQKWIAGRVGE